ncbi:MAG: sensor histidine kinase [Asticcacaulis sp.]
MLAALLIWGVAYLGWTAEWVAWKAPHAVEHLVRRAVLCVMGACLCWLISAFLDRVKPKKWLIKVPVGIALSLVCLAGYLGLHFLLFYKYNPLWGPYSFRESILVAEGGCWVFLLWAAVYFAILAFEEAYDTQLKLSEASQAELKSRYHALTVQTQPHFLFNALNSISALIMEKDLQRAEKVVLALAGLLRTNFETESRQSITLRDELDCVRKYLEIEGIRYDRRLVSKVSVPDPCLDLRVPPLILLPVVENVVRHGVSRSAKPVTLPISAEVRGESLHITVQDDAVPEAGSMPAPGAGIGQANVRQRLSILFGREGSLSCTQDEQGYRSVVAMPAVRRDDA